MKRSPYFRTFPISLLAGCHRASGEEVAVHDALAAKYGEAVAQSVVGRPRAEADRKKSDMGKCYKMLTDKLAKLMNANPGKARLWSIASALSAAPTVKTRCTKL